jgi:Uma2 family endonuclease
MTLAPETLLDEEYEQERGKPLPSLNHGVVQAKLSFALISAYQDQYLVGSEITLATEPPLTPDLIVSSERQLDWLRDEIRVAEAPLTVFEIVSPSQSINDFIPRIESYFRFGVRSVWLVHPPLKQVVVFERDTDPKVIGEGEIVDPALDVRIALEEIFT